ncbi:transposase, partial [Bacteroidota bacterium]
IEECVLRIGRIDDQIKDLIKSDDSLKKNFDLATSVKGIGLVIAAFMLVTTNNFTSFEDGRKYACYSGIAPFESSSGNFQGKAKVSHLANKRVKALLSNGANAAYKWDPEIKAYYERKIKEGKHHKLVINSIRCKLVNRVFAVVKRQTPYVNIYQQKFA